MLFNAVYRYYTVFYWCYTGVILIYWHFIGTLCQVIYGCWCLKYYTLPIHTTLFSFLYSLLFLVIISSYILFPFKVFFVCPLLGFLIEQILLTCFVSFVFPLFNSIFRGVIIPFSFYLLSGGVLRRKVLRGVFLYCNIKVAYF